MAPEPLHCSPFLDSRDIVTFVSAADIMRRRSARVVPSTVLGQKCTLIIFNVSRDPDILHDEEASNGRLMGVLSELHDLLADNGTLIIALKDMGWNQRHLQREQIAYECLASRYVVPGCFLSYLYPGWREQNLG